MVTPMHYKLVIMTDDIIIISFSVIIIVKHCATREYYYVQVYMYIHVLRKQFSTNCNLMEATLFKNYNIWLVPFTMKKVPYSANSRNSNLNLFFSLFDTRS